MCEGGKEIFIMDDSFFTRPWVWALAVCMVGLVLLARCEEEREVFDPYAWSGELPEAGCPSSPDMRTMSGYAVAPALPSPRGYAEAGRSSAPADDADGYALEVYEFELVENSLPPCEF